MKLESNYLILVSDHFDHNEAANLDLTGKKYRHHNYTRFVCRKIFGQKYNRQK